MKAYKVQEISFAPQKIQGYIFVKKLIIDI
jgi:hypothetical protein